MGQNHVWRYTLRLFTHFSISKKCRKMMPKCYLNRSQSSSLSDIEIKIFPRPLAKRFLGVSRPLSGAQKRSYSFFKLVFWISCSNMGCRLLSPFPGPSVFSSTWFSDPCQGHPQTEFDVVLLPLGSFLALF